MDQSPLESSTPSAHHPVVLENSSREGSSGMVSVIGGQSSHPAGPSGTIVAIPSPGSGDDDPMSINDTARTEKLIAACSSLPPSITSGGTLSLTVTVAVFNSDIERPDISQTYKIQPTDGCVAALIFMVTDPKHPENQLTTLRDHTRWYVRETGRHWYTKDGLAFRRLVPEQSLRDIPASNDTCTVCVVQSDRPYMVLSTGRRYLGVTAGTAEPDKGVVVKDYLDLDLVESCTYYNRVLHAEHSVTVEKKQKWRDLPRHQVHDYSADWLMVFPSDA
ncbi:hypothetical protein FRB95_005158 [Tulasnella sp. JGI-2019a]|nr:hypothetical protein FRB95_005158 [Tulasnella sp. JGI-2019a]